MTEVVLYGGKGGVGKTTVASAAALRSARDGATTLVVSTDPAHSLGDAVGTSLGADPTAITDRLWGVETDPQAGVDRYRALFETLAADFADAGVRVDEDALVDLFTAGVLPGSDELAALDGLATYLDADRWDRVVFDTAPTGHTLRLLDLPAVMDRGLATALDLREGLRRKLNAARTMAFGPLAARRTEAPPEFVDLRERLDRVGTVLRDPDRTDFRVVTVPEPMAVRETERLVADLRSFEVPVTTLVVNRVLADPCDCERCQMVRDEQEAALGTLREEFPALETRTVPDQSGAVTGLAALRRVADHLR